MNLIFLITVPLESKHFHTPLHELGTCQIVMQNKPFISKAEKPSLLHIVLSSYLI